MFRWGIVVLFVIVLFALTGCSAKKERVVLTEATKIEVIQPDPRLMESPGSKKVLIKGTDNGTAGEIMQFNNTLCKNNEDKLVSLQGYTAELLKSLKSKPDLILVK